MIKKRTQNAWRTHLTGTFIIGLPMTEVNDIGRHQRPTSH